MREDELAGRSLAECHCLAAVGLDQLGVDEAASAEVHPILRLALSHQRRADGADAHRRGDLGSPPVLERRAGRRLTAARLTGDQHALYAGPGQVDATLRGA